MRMDVFMLRIFQWNIFSSREFIQIKEERGNPKVEIIIPNQIVAAVEFKLWGSLRHLHQNLIIAALFLL